MKKIITYLSLISALISPDVNAQSTVKPPFTHPCPLKTSNTLPLKTSSTTPLETSSTTPLETTDTLPLKTSSTLPLKTPLVSTYPLRADSTAPLKTSNTTPLETTDTAPSPSPSPNKATYNTPSTQEIPYLTFSSVDIFSATASIPEKSNYVLSATKNNPVPAAYQQYAQFVEERLTSYNPTYALPINQNIYFQPVDLITWWRFDIVAKYIYAFHYEHDIKSNWARELYTALLYVWGGAQEWDNSRNNIQEYLASFHNVIESIKTSGFNPDTSKIRIDNRKFPCEGAHRIATALLYNKPVACYYDPNPHLNNACQATATFFREFDKYVPSGLAEKYLDAMALQYCELKPDTRMIIVVTPDCDIFLPAYLTILPKYPAILPIKQIISPSDLTLFTDDQIVTSKYPAILPNKHIISPSNHAISAASQTIPPTNPNLQEIQKLLRLHGNIVYHKTCTLTRSGIQYLFGQLFDSLPHPTKLHATVFLFEPREPQTLSMLTDMLSHHFHDKPYVFLNGLGHQDAVKFAQTFFVSNSLDFINNGRVWYCNQFEHHKTALADLKAWIENNAINPSFLCIDFINSLPHEQNSPTQQPILTVHYHGTLPIPQSPQLNFVQSPQLNSVQTPELNSVQTPQLNFVQTPESDDIIFNPSRHFYHRGVKFVMPTFTTTQRLNLSCNALPQPILYPLPNQLCNTILKPII